MFLGSLLLNISNTTLLLRSTDSNLHPQMKLKVGKSPKSTRTHNQTCEMAESHMKSTLPGIFNLNANSFS